MNMLKSLRVRGSSRRALRVVLSAASLLGVLGTLTAMGGPESVPPPVVSYPAVGVAEATPVVHAVDRIGITVADLDRSVEFYTSVLGFEKLAETESFGDVLERTTGVFGARVRTADLRLGDERIELTQYL